MDIDKEARFRSDIKTLTDRELLERVAVGHSDTQEWMKKNDNRITSTETRITKLEMWKKGILIAGAALGVVYHTGLDLFQLVLGFREVHKH